MPTGIGIRLPVRFNNPALRKRRDDAILTRGSLVLIDFAHSANPLAGVPVGGVGNIPNIAWKEAAALHGAGSQADWALDAVVTMSAGDGFIERTSKGGVHVCMSQSTHTGTAKGFAVRKQLSATSPLLQYLYANRDHDFYFSRWAFNTRLGQTTNPELAEAAIYSYSAGNNTNGLIQLNRTGGVNRSLGIKDVPAVPQGIGPSFRSAGMDGWSASGRPTSAGDIIAAFMAVGQQPSLFNAAPVNKSRSSIEYRCYLEDRTASGRSHAEVEDIDETLKEQAFAEGGRFFNDVFTPPIP